MSAKATAILTWSYSPRSLFEEAVSVHFESGEVVIDNGTAEGRFAPHLYEQGRDFRDSVHESVTNVFLAQQVMTAKEFDLQPPAMCREHPDGKRDVTVFPDSLVMKMSVGQADTVVRDASGNVVSDSKADRLQRHASFRTGVLNLLPGDRVLRCHWHCKNDPLTAT